jgi:hypothetical protein
VAGLGLELVTGFAGVFATSSALAIALRSAAYTPLPVSANVEGVGGVTAGVGRFDGSAKKNTLSQGNFFSPSLISQWYAYDNGRVNAATQPTSTLVHSFIRYATTAPTTADTAVDQLGLVATVLLNPLLINFSFCLE